MNREEAKQILLIYRPGTADAEDPEVAEALALAQSDPELSHWLEEHCARQNALREKFRQIPVLAGLKEQITSEEAAKWKTNPRREKMVAVAAVVVILVALGLMTSYFFPGHNQQTTGYPPDNTLANYRNTMVYYAQGYAMSLLTNNAAQIQAYLATSQAPSDYVLPAGLQKTALAGCAVENWQNSKISMICFLTGKPLPQSRQSDLWLFVIDSHAIKDAPTSASPQFAVVDGIMTATWTRNGKIYLLSVAGNQDAIKKYL